jgi:hypothetical protein
VNEPDSEQSQLDRFLDLLYSSDEATAGTSIRLPENLREAAEGQGRGTASFLPRRITQFRAEDLELVDLRQPEHLAAVGLDLEDLTAHFLRTAGIIAPSAVGIGDTIAIFEARIASAALRITDGYMLGP